MIQDDKPLSPPEASIEGSIGIPREIKVELTQRKALFGISGRSKIDVLDDSQPIVTPGNFIYLLIILIGSFGRLNFQAFPREQQMCSHLIKGSTLNSSFMNSI